MDSKPQITVVGSINIDFTTNTPRVPGPGETLLATSLSVNAGGKGANQAVACGRAAKSNNGGPSDVQVAMIGAVGADDPYVNKLVIPTLQEAGIDCSRILQSQSAQTGTASIIVDDGANGENRIMVVPGANHASMHDRVFDASRGLGRPGSVIIMQGEIPEGEVYSVIRHVYHNLPETISIFNPAPVFEGGVPMDILSMVHVLVVNETELLDLTRRQQPPTEEGNMDIAEVDDIVKSLVETGVREVIVTLGARGVYWRSKSGTTCHVPSIKVKAIDSTAAGDTFVGFLAVALARKEPMQRALELANKAAAVCVQRRGAMQSIPWGFEV